MIGVSRCGSFSYIPSSTCFGSIRMKRTSSGVALNRIDMIMALMPTLLPEPVKPPIRRCGMRCMSATNGRPWMSLPSASVSGEAEWTNFEDSMISRSTIVWRSGLGTSIPTVALPGMRSIRTASTCRPRARSSSSRTTCAYLTPAAGRNS